MISTSDCYQEAARSASEGSLSCCAPCAPQYFGSASYSKAELSLMPPGAIDAAMGFGNPSAEAELASGEAVVDLGCGAGIDALLAAHRVGPTGTVIGIDMTEGLVALSRQHAKLSGISNAEFHVGFLENPPLRTGSTDVALANAAISLSEDKPSVFSEVHRVLSPEGRFIFIDFILQDDLERAQRVRANSASGCQAGTLSASEFANALVESGFRDPVVRLDHEVVPGMYIGLVSSLA